MSLFPKVQRKVQADSSLQETTDKLTDLVQPKAKSIILGYTKPFYGSVNVTHGDFRISDPHGGLYWFKTSMIANDKGTLVIIDLSIPSSRRLAVAALICIVFSPVLGILLTTGFGLEGLLTLACLFLAVAILSWYFIDKEFRIASESIDFLETKLQSGTNLQIDKNNGNTQPSEAYPSMSRHLKMVSNSSADAPILHESTAKDNWVELVSVTEYAGAFRYLLGNDYGKEFSGTFLAKLRPESTNANDSNAVQVFVDNRLIGYLAKEAAGIVKRAEADGLIPNGLLETTVRIELKSEFGQNHQSVYSATVFLPSVDTIKPNPKFVANLFSLFFWVLGIIAIFSINFLPNIRIAYDLLFN